VIGNLADAFTIRLLGAGDEAIVAEGALLFDHTPIPDQTSAFLRSERDFIWFAMAGSGPIGFVSASILLHPDKEPHLFVNELGVDDNFRRQGIATRLMQAVVHFGRERGLWPIWVAAEGDDHAAQAFYRSLSGMTERGAIVYEWE
jgi:ribosomal protein S18 acetylase RimI-like enzyme